MVSHKLFFEQLVCEVFGLFIQAETCKVVQWVKGFFYFCFPFGCCWFFCCCCCFIYQSSFMAQNSFMVVAGFFLFWFYSVFSFLFLTIFFLSFTLLSLLFFCYFSTVLSDERWKLGGNVCEILNNFDMPFHYFFITDLGDFYFM